jgi:hypothetical protein
MKFIKIFLILLLFLFQTPCYAENLSWGETAQNIRCSLMSSAFVLKKGIPAPVTIIIENMSLEPKRLSVSAGFNLGRMEYWAPVKLGLVSEHLRANETFELSMQPREQRRYQVDLANLKWAKSISSIWPYGELFSVVKAGNYLLSFDIQFGNNTTPNRARSNEINVRIK